ncbi:alpha/beta hydrolase [Streptosporangium sp. NPDC006930]|uniref:alpha/beta fold hydrolase n=1 Tax=unclassified Streptosporangium TaxID=2632669 RepID=UPI003433669E
MLNDLPYLSAGKGPPLVVLLYTPQAANPRGLARWSTMRLVQPFTEHFTVYVVNRRPGLPSGTTMADLAAVYAQAIRGISEGPVNMLAISTGGSIALQLAADHPGLVDRLVLAGTACTLGPIGRRAQRAYIERSRQGRRPSPALAEVVTESTIGRGCSKACCGCLTAVTKTTPTPSSSSTPRMASTCVNGCTASRRSRC